MRISDLIKELKSYQVTQGNIDVVTDIPGLDYMVDIQTPWITPDNSLYIGGKGFGLPELRRYQQWERDNED